MLRIQLATVVAAFLIVTISGEPLPAPINVKPGSCPMMVQGCREGQIDPVDCSEDFECPGNLKCCSTGCGGRICVAPEPTILDPPALLVIEEKPGQCLVSKRACVKTEYIPENKCGVDIDCEGDLKCCQNPCGNMDCSEPYLPQPPEVKPGRCIMLMIACYNPTYIPKDKCLGDGDCEGDGKCCPQPCGNLVCTQQ